MCSSFDEDDVEEIQGLLDTFIVGFEGDQRRNRVVAYRKKITIDARELAALTGKTFDEDYDFSELDLDDIANQLENVQMPEIVTDDDIPDADIEDRFVYDLELPDGTIIQNITEDGIEYYNQNYILKYVNAFTQSVQEALASV
jgi:hypothetical protein